MFLYYPGNGINLILCQCPRLKIGTRRQGLFECMDKLEHHNEQAIKTLESYKLLTGSLALSLLISTSLAFIMTAILHGQVDSTKLLLWIITIVSVNIIRLVAYYRFNVADAFDHHKIVLYLRFFRIGALISGLVWGWAGFFFAREVELAYQLFITFTLGGLAVGASSSLATDKFAVIAFTLATILPNAFHYFLSDDELPLAMGVMLILFIGFMLNTAKDQGKNLHENLSLRIQAKRDETQFREILNFSPVAASISSIESLQTLFVNKRHLELFETSSTLFSTENGAAFSVEETQFEAIKAKLRHGQNVTDQLLKITLQDSGEDKWCIGSFLLVNYLNSPAVLCWFYDITDRVKMEDQIKHLAYHDSLTDLPNRYLFEDRLKLALKHARRNTLLLGVMFIDLDGFKAINDTHGHDVGDLLLKAVAERLTARLRMSDTLSRVGGDEFIVLLPEIAGVRDGINVAQKLLVAMAEPFNLAGTIIRLSASIGMAFYPQHGDTDQTLLKNADTAMYEAKKNGRNNAQIYLES